MLSKLAGNTGISSLGFSLHQRWLRCCPYKRKIFLLTLTNETPLCSKHFSLVRKQAQVEAVLYTATSSQFETVHIASTQIFVEWINEL